MVLVWLWQLWSIIQHYGGHPANFLDVGRMPVVLASTEGGMVEEAAAKTPENRRSIKM